MLEAAHEARREVLRDRQVDRAPHVPVEIAGMIGRAGRHFGITENESNVGRLGTKRMVPACAPDPYKVPCGPRRTSTRSTSYNGMGKKTGVSPK